MFDQDFAAFLKKRSSIEEEHAQSLKRLARSTSEATRRPDARQGSFARNYDDITRIHDRMADNGIQFALSLHQMHEDLQELAREKDAGRKHWKQQGLSAEKRVADAEAAMDKAKAKYFSYAEDYDRARTGDKQSGRFGLKGPKSAAQVEEDLNRKMQTSDQEYSSRVQTAHGMRLELTSTLRPQAVHALEQLIHETDNGLALQMQKFGKHRCCFVYHTQLSMSQATFNEKLLLGNGICVSPLKANDGPEAATTQQRSLRDAVHSINNEQDLTGYIVSFAGRLGPGHPEPRYEKHHVRLLCEIHTAAWKLTLLDPASSTANRKLTTDDHPSPTTCKSSSITNSAVQRTPAQPFIRQ